MLNPTSHWRWLAMNSMAEINSMKKKAIIDFANVLTSIEIWLTTLEKSSGRTGLQKNLFIQPLT